VPRKVFVAGEILTAADVNANLMDQAVMVFDDAAARTTAIPSPIEGMVTYLKSADLVEIYDGSAWRNSLNVTGGILQVVSVTRTSVFSASVAQGGEATVTDFTATITPKSTTSKVLVNVSLSLSTSLAGTDGAFSVFRGATKIALGDASGSRGRVSSSAASVGNAPTSASTIFLDSPNTTSATDYTVAIRHDTNTTQTVYLNRSKDDNDNNFNLRGVSTITVMEVSG